MGRLATFDHTQKTDRRIIRAYQRGERLRDVAAELGTTRNTLIGRARILGLCETGGDIAASKKFNEGNPDVLRRWLAEHPAEHRKSIAAMHAGRDRYWAARKAERQPEGVA